MILSPGTSGVILRLGIAILFGWLSHLPSIAADNAGVATQTQFQFLLSPDQTIPEARIADEGICGLQLRDRSLLVDAETRGIANMVVRYLPEGKLISPENRESQNDGVANRDSPATWRLKDCRFFPRILVVQPGQMIEIQNLDLINHTMTIQPLISKSRSLFIPVTTTQRLMFGSPEPAPVAIDGCIPPYMDGSIVVANPAHVGVSDSHGFASISRLPRGTPLTFILQHERLHQPIASIKLNGKPLPIQRNRFQITLPKNVKRDRLRLQIQFPLD